MRILQKKILADVSGMRVVEMTIQAPAIASKAQAGQFVVLMVKEEGERIPLTIVDTDIAQGALTIIFQEVGLTTRLLAKLESGDSLFALAGPLGHPTQIQNYGKVILIGGGVGIAEVYPVAKALKEQNELTIILGARTKELLILEKELKNLAEEFYITTDDGSYGQKGFVTDVLKKILSKKQYALVYAVGPIPMMRAVSKTTQEFGTKTIVSLNALMVDATGMCGCCRVSVAGQTKFSCVDGPEFDAQDIDWEELSKRNNIYKEKEEHICKLYLK